MIIHGTITVSARVQKINNESEGSISKSGNVNDSYGSMKKNSDNITTSNTEKESFKTLDDEPALKDYDSSNEISST